MANFNAENDRLVFNIEQFCLINGASDFVHYFLRFNYDKIREEQIIKIFAPVDDALQRLVDKTGKSLEQISNLPEGINVLNNFLSPNVFNRNYPYWYTAINGTTYGKTASDITRLRASNQNKFGDIEVWIINAIIKRNDQQIDTLTRAGPLQNTVRRKTGIIGSDLVTNLDDLPNPILRQIVLNISLVDIVNNCRVNNQFNATLCDSEDFWNEKLRKDHPYQRSMIGKSWKETYKMLAGNLYTFGNSGSGRLGVGAVSYQYEPKLVQSLTNVSAVSCGGVHTAAISNGQLYTWGKGLSGQLGHGNAEYRGVPWLVQDSDGVTAVACGASHTAMIFKGKLYTCGNGEFGRLGDGGDARFRGIFNLIEGLDNVSAVACGVSHTAAVANGRLYTFGNGQFGRLGHGDERDQFRPKLVEGLDNVTLVACGQSHTAAIANGLLYTFGNGLFGRLGHGDERNQSTPVLIQDLNGVTSVACAASYTAAISGERLYTFGQGLFGRLGQGDEQNYLRPKLVEILNNVTMVACGTTHTAVIANRQIYTFGTGTYGQLGQGAHRKDLDTEVPKLIDHLYDVVSISCGDEHTAVIASRDDLKNPIAK